MVSLLDTYRTEEVEKFVKDEKNYIPVVFGIDTKGKVIMKDLKDMESMLIVGEPRSGKSWFAQAILYQMCAYMSPKDLHLYVYLLRNLDYFIIVNLYIYNLGKSS